MGFHGISWITWNSMEPIEAQLNPSKVKSMHEILDRLIQPVNDSSAGLLLQFAPRVFLLVWQKVMCDQVATKPLITRGHVVFIQLDTLCSIVDTLCRCGK